MTVNILIGTPAYNGMVHIDYLNSILSFHAAKLPITNICIGNESLITRGRNTIFSFFYEHQEFTHLLFLDADIGISAESIIRLISHGQSVIGAPVPLKGYDSKGNKVYNVTNPVKTETPNLFTVNKLGTAVFMIDRKAANSLAEKAETYEGNSLTRGVGNIATKHYDVFKTGVEVIDGKNVYLSEDYFCCKTLRALGYKIYVDDTILVRHNGMYSF